MIDSVTRNAYSEILELFKQMDIRDVQKIPRYLRETMEEFRNREYAPKVDLCDIDNTLSRKAKALYSGLYIKYICDDPEEIAVIEEILLKNEQEASENRNKMKE